MTLFNPKKTLPRLGATPTAATPAAVAPPTSPMLSTPANDLDALNAKINDLEARVTALEGAGGGPTGGLGGMMGGPGGP